ncbi:MAG: TnpV protein [Clostridiales bacterium]|nr:TnpV protein [Clostridiales bacterium]
MTQEALTAHLVALDAAARYMVETLTADLAKQRGVDEDLKASDRNINCLSRKKKIIPNIYMWKTSRLTLLFQTNICITILM